MSYLENIGAHLEEQGIGTWNGRSRDIFAYQMPSTISEGILLKDNALGTELDHELPGYISTEFYGIVRSTEHAKGEALANALSTALTINITGTYGGLAINFVRPRIIPMVFPVSEGDYLEFLVSFDINFCT